MNEIAITRYCDVTDRSQVIALWNSALDYHAPHNRPALSIDRKLASGDDLFFVARLGATVIGTVMAGYDGHRGWIYSVAVAAEHRRKGVGSQLVQAAERALAAKGCVKINLQITEGNEIVTAFYHALGFSVEKRISMGKRIPENISSDLV